MKESTGDFEIIAVELEQAAVSILRRAKEKAFSRGLPIYFGKGGKVFAEYANGYIEEVKINGSRK